MTGMSAPVRGCPFRTNESLPQTPPWTAWKIPSRFPFAGAVQEGAAQKAFSVGRKDDIDGVVHACRNDGFEVGAVRTHAKEVRCLADKGASIAERVALFGVGAFGPVDEAIRAGVGTVQVVGAKGQGFTVEPDVALIGNAIASGVCQFPDLRRCGDIERSIQP